MQTPHPPVIVGGAFPYGARRAVQYGDGWIPHASRKEYGDVLEFLPRFHQMAAEAGRDIASLPVSVWGAPEDGDRLNRLRDAGVARVIITFKSAPEADLLGKMDRWAELIRKLNQ